MATESTQSAESPRFPVTDFPELVRNLPELKSAASMLEEFEMLAQRAGFKVKLVSAVQQRPQQRTLEGFLDAVAEEVLGRAISDFQKEPQKRLPVPPGLCAFFRGRSEASSTLPGDPQKGD